jgi:hypothetical protein
VLSNYIRLIRVWQGCCSIFCVRTYITAGVFLLSRKVVYFTVKLLYFVVRSFRNTVRCLFQNSSDELLRDIYRKLIAPFEATLDLNDYPGLQRLCYDRNYAHLASDYMLLLPGCLPQCSITLVPQAFYPGTMAIATAKRSPYLGLLNFM